MDLRETAAAIFDLCQGDHNTDQIKALVSAYADEQLKAAKRPYHVPGPYEIALRLGCALASSGLYPTPGAAVTAAWFAVPEFYMGRDAYLNELAPVVAGGDLTAAAASPFEGGAHDGETLDS